MVRSFHRRCGAGLLAVVVVGLLGVVFPSPARAIGGVPNAAIYYRDTAGTIKRAGPDGIPMTVAVDAGIAGGGFAVAHDGTVYASNIGTGKIHKTPPGGLTTEVSFSNPPSYPQYLAVDGANTLYASSGADVVMKRDAGGGESMVPFPNLGQIGGMAVDQDGNVYVLDNMSGDLMMTNTGGITSTLASAGDIPAAETLTVDNQKRLYLSANGGLIYRVDQSTSPATITTINPNIGNIGTLTVAPNGDLYEYQYANSLSRVLDNGTVVPVLAPTIPLTNLAVLTVPAPPTTVTATPGISSATVHWNAPHDNGGDPIVRVNVLSDPGNLSCAPNTPAGTECTVTGLTDGTAYTFHVVASNTAMTWAGESLPSGASDPVTAGLPEVPTALQATPADAAADISFVPGSSGAAPNQTFETSIDAGNSWQPLTTQPGNGGALTGTVTNLSNGAPATVRLRGRNTYGPGPAADTSVTAVSPSPSPSPSSSSPSPSPSVSSPSPSTTSPSPSVTTPTPTLPPATSPTPSPSPSATSSPSPSTTPKPTVPNPPTAVTIAAGSSSVQVSWQAPVDNGIPVTGYRAIADPGPAVCVTTGATSCVLGGTAGTTYRVRVLALAAKGNSAPSAYSNSAKVAAPDVATTPPATSVPLNTDQGQISTATPGQSVTLVGDGYAAYSSVTLTIYSTPVVLGTTVTDKHGAFAKPVTVPADLHSGEHTFTATGVDPSGRPRAMRMDVTVHHKPGKLPVTGPSVVWLIVAGLGLTAIGAGMRAVRP